MPAQVLRRLLLLLVVLAAAWGIALLVTRGFVIEAPWGRLSSRNATRPLWLAVLAGLFYALRWRDNWRTDAGPLAGRLGPGHVAALLTALTFVFATGFGAFVAAGADAAGYVSQADRWVNGGLTAPAPAWVRGAPWPDAEYTALPLGYVPGPEPFTQVPSYAPGLPLMMALLQAIAGPSAVYLVVPLLGALAVWMSYLLGRSLAGPWAGVGAAFLLVASPGFLFLLVQPMSDVPVTAFWALALYAALNPGAAAAVAAGAATSLAIATRPNLVPLAVIVAAIAVATPRPRRLRDLLYFGAAALPGVLVIALVNAAWYGSPLRSGYGSVETIYHLENIAPNLRYYGGLLLGMQTPLILLGLAAPFVIRRSAERAAAALAFTVFPLAVLGLYLPYLFFGEWPYVRFLLPAFPPLLAATAAALVTLTGWIRHRGVGMAVAVLVLTAAALHSLDYTPAPFELARGEQRFAAAGEFARGLPEDAVLLSWLHAGSLHYYSGRDVLRWELLDPAYLDTAIDRLRALNRPVYLVVDPNEAQTVQDRFPQSRTVTALEAVTPEVIERVAFYRIN